MAFQKGKPKTGGRVAGTTNKATVEFKEAITRLLNHATPKMIGWLDVVAAEDPMKALDVVSKLAEYVQPKLARTEHAGDQTAPIQHVVKWDGQ